MIEKPISKLIQTLEAQSFSIIGAPGADGLGVEAMLTYAAAIEEAQGDFIVTLGDVSPLGRDPYYRTVAGILDQAAEKPMYVVPGVGDGPAFEQHFGHRDKAVLSEEFTLVMLDNSGRGFSRESLSFLRDTLAIVDSPNIVVAFHYPPPNRVSGDSLPADEWAKFEEAAGVWRKRITMLVAAHARGYFEDEVDGLTLVVTGGGGAALRDFDRAQRPPHHLVEFGLDDQGKIRAKPRALSVGGKPDRIAVVSADLDESFRNQCRAHACHLLDAEDAERRGLANLARLFRVAAESHLRHARNLRRVIARSGGPAAMVEAALATSAGGEGDSNLRRIASAETAHDYLAAHAFRDMAASEIVNTGLFESALADLSGGGDIEATGYHVCSSCGVVFTGFSAPDNCSECGAPGGLIGGVE